MNADDLAKKILAVARALPPRDHVPLAFEKRIMARLAAQPSLDIWAIWSQMLWRAAAPCVGIMLVLSAWSIYSQHSNTSEAFAADFERTVWGPLNSIGDTW